MASYEATYGKIDASMRMFGMPHQLLEHNDPRLGATTDLGAAFAETMIIEAPIISIKPGVAEFLPGKSKSEKEGYINQFIDAARNNSAKNELQKLYDEESDSLKWFQHKAAYSDYMIGVNMICRTMAVLYGVDKEEVPWVKGHVTFGYYDWRYYRLGKQYEGSQNVNVKNQEDGQGWARTMIKIISNLKHSIENDDQYVDFYVDANVSFSESSSNSTSQSMLASYTDRVESIAKEASFIGMIAAGSEGYDSFVEGVSGDIDDLFQSTADALTPDSGVFNALGTLFKRMSSGAKQVIRGGNFVLPEHYSDSSYGKNYSFSVTLATPYGTKLAHFLNVGVPMAFILGMFWPVQMSANTFKSPYLLKCFSPGWFNCSIGIGDSCNIDVGGDGGWAANGLPNEVKISVSIKDLYSQMYIPHKLSDFIENSGMIEFLMVKCAVDITNQDLFLATDIWIHLLAGSIEDKVTSAPVQIKQALLDRIRNKFVLLK